LTLTGHNNWALGCDLRRIQNHQDQQDHSQDEIDPDEVDATPLNLNLILSEKKNKSKHF